MSRVYVGRIPPRCCERDIERFFKGYGRLRDIVLKNGYGFVEFDNEKDADDAVYDLHGRDLRGERLIVEHARLPPGTRGGSRRAGGGGGGGGFCSNRDRRYGPPTRTEYRVIVENLSTRVSWQDLKDLMRKAGEVTYADAHKSAKNDGIVEFAAYCDMKEAIEKFDGYELYGRKLRVYEDRPGHRSRSSSYRSRSNSRHSHRSRSRGSHRRQKSEVLGIDMIDRVQVIDEGPNPATVRTDAQEKTPTTYDLGVRHAVPGQTVPTQDPFLITAKSAQWMFVLVLQAAMVERIA
ncbi:unnamed protein product [Schistosoma mattheei]|uniref:RRM domain-containing protein n=1 Tax=Schistosoma mattheei TaxID=31246 RepID=A0AA85B827_9TREM|nr:unnamed protein product [Schistosoma mattheei]